MKECANSTRKIHISSNFILSISLLITFDTLLLRPSLHCSTLLHFTTLQPTTLHHTSVYIRIHIHTLERRNLFLRDMKIFNYRASIMLLCPGTHSLQFWVFLVSKVQSCCQQKCHSEVHLEV